MAYASNKMISALVADRKEFTGNTMKGRIKGKNAILSTGRMPQEFVDELLSDVNAMEDNAIIYFVYSYTTVIGWWTYKNGWKRPMVSYLGDSGKVSTTTSKHQGMIPESTRLYPVV
jgi:hypothetical protein